MNRARKLLFALALLGPALAACGDDPAGPGTNLLFLEFSSNPLDLDTETRATVELRNSGEESAGPLTLSTLPLVEVLSFRAEMGSVGVDPSRIAGLGPGESVAIEITVQPADSAGPGLYGSPLRVEDEAGGSTSVPVRFRIPDPRAPDAFRIEVEVDELPTSVREGDALRPDATVFDSAGAVLEDAPVRWTVAPPDAGVVAGDSLFVGYGSGTARLRASVGGIVDSAAVDLRSRNLSGSLGDAGRGGPPSRVTSDLWVHDDAAYTGTWGRGDEDRPEGNTLLVWDVSDPAEPALVDSLTVDATTVNDVKVSADGTLGVLTHEGSSDERNGITLLDLANPHHPEIFARFTDRLERGVHNVWIEGDHVYAAENGANGTGGLRVIDISDPRSPELLATWQAGDGSGRVTLHDVYVRDGLAFLSYWDAGLIILDVGRGLEGGSPANPVEVGRVLTEGGQTHNAWYWPATGYVFVGEEDFDESDPGVLHVVDARDLRNPREVATYEAGGTVDPPHNVWLDEDRPVLYAAWYGAGVHAIDVTGELVGELDRQGRTIAETAYAGGGGLCDTEDDELTTCAWAPQLHGDHLFVSDMDLGLVVLRPDLTGL